MDKQIKLTIKKVNLYPIRSYKITDEDKVCQICKIDHIVCIECLKNKKNIKDMNCPFALGKCGHGFHRHCIDRWSKESDSCPLCNIPWIWKTKDINVYDRWKAKLKKKNQKICS